MERMSGNGVPCDAERRGGGSGGAEGEREWEEGARRERAQGEKRRQLWEEVEKSWEFEEGGCVGSGVG
eukprot:1630438-Rhodomonas_salina.1